MDPATFALVLLTCTPDSLLCREVPEADIKFSAYEECESVLNTVLDRFEDERFIVKGNCVDSQKAQRHGKDWAVSATSDIIDDFERVPVYIERAGGSPAPGQQIDETRTASVDFEQSDSREEFLLPGNSSLESGALFGDKDNSTFGTVRVIRGDGSGDFKAESYRVPQDN